MGEVAYLVAAWRWCSDNLVTIIEDEFAGLAPSMSLDVDGLESSIFDEFTAFSEPVAVADGPVSAPAILEDDFSAFSVTDRLDGAIIDRVPGELEDYFGDEDVDELIQVMFDPTKRDQHANAVNFVGLISSGKDAHVQALVDYVPARGEHRRGHALARLHRQPKRQ
jgi:hypothetical protein